MQVTDFEVWLDKLNSLLAGVPAEYAIAAFFLPVVLAVFSQRTILIFACFVGAGSALVALIHPNSIALVIVVGAYAGSILLAIFGIQTRRRDLAVRTELTALQSELDALRTTEERRYLVELKKGSRTSEDAK